MRESVIYYIQKEKRRIKEMRDYFKRVRCRDGYCRMDCTNKVARQRAKREIRKEAKDE